MPLATRVGIDTAGGGLVTGAPGALQTFVTIDGAPWALLGASIADHGNGSHNAATIAQGSTFVRIDGVPVARAGHLATCGHAVTGSGFVSIAD